MQSPATFGRLSQVWKISCVGIPQFTQGEARHHFSSLFCSWSAGCSTHMYPRHILPWAPCHLINLFSVSNSQNAFCCLQPSTLMYVCGSAQKHPYTSFKIQHDCRQHHHVSLLGKELFIYLPVYLSIYLFI